MWCTKPSRDPPSLLWTDRLFLSSLEILEIKIRVFHKTLEIQEVAPWLWVSQTGKLVRAYHRKGTFQGPEVEDLAALIKRREEPNQTDQRKLAAPIKKILNVVKGCGGNAIVKYDVKEDKLLLGRLTGKRCSQRTCIPNETIGTTPKRRSIRNMTQELRVL